jgi:hypothetical protein
MDVARERSRRRERVPERECFAEALREMEMA